MIMRYAARSVLAGHRRREPLLHQDIHHQQGRTHTPAVSLLVMSHRGQIGVTQSHCAGATGQ